MAIICVNYSTIMVPATAIRTISISTSDGIPEDRVTTVNYTITIVVNITCVPAIQRT